MDHHDGWVTDTFNAEDERTAAIIAQERQRERDMVDGNDDGVDVNADVVQETDPPERNTIARHGGGTVRITLRMPKYNKQQLQYYADVAELSMSEYMLRALENQIARDNGHFDGETINTARWNIIADEMAGVKYSMANLESTVSSLVRMISTMATGETNLLDIDDEDGEL